MRDGKTRTTQLKDAGEATNATNRRHHHESHQPHAKVPQRKERRARTVLPASRTTVITRKSADSQDSAGTKKTPTRLSSGKTANNDTLQLVEALQQTLQINTSGTAAETCPILYVTRSALRSAIEHIQQPAYTTNDITPTRRNRMDDKETVPPSPGHLPPRNLSNELDTAQQGQELKEGDTAMQRTDMGTIETADPTRTSCTEHPSTPQGADEEDPKNQQMEEASPHRETQKSPFARNPNVEESSEPQPTVMDPQFRAFCGNPKTGELRTGYLEHHVGSLIIRVQAMEEREQKQ